jgi:hypothetical protein
MADDLALRHIELGVALERLLPVRIGFGARTEVFVRVADQVVGVGFFKAVADLLGRLAGLREVVESLDWVAGQADKLAQAVERVGFEAELAGVVFVGCEEPSCVGFSRDQDVVEEFASDGADDPFAVGVHPGCLKRAFDDA